MLRALLKSATVYGVAASLGATAAYGADKVQRDHVRRVVLDSRQMGAHGPGYGERSLNELSRKLKPADIPALLELLDEHGRGVAAGVIFGLASQCGAAIDPVYAHAAGETKGLQRYSDARDVYTQMTNFKRCTAAERKLAAEKSAQLELAERDFATRRTRDVKRCDDEDARLQAQGMKLQDPAQRAAVSREDCLALVERNRAAAGVKPGSVADAGELFQRARANCMSLKQESTP